jgi:hypothetical protein
MNAEAKAPGCFGSPSMHAMDSAHCQKCVAYTECGKVAHETLGNLAQVMDVADLMKRHAAARKKYAKPAPVVTELFEAGTLPDMPLQLCRKPTVVKYDVDEKTMELIGGIKNAKARTQALALARANMVERSIEALADGKNPFEQTPPKFLKVACDQLLLGGFTKADLKAQYVQSLGNTAETAAWNVTMAVSVLGAFRITQQVGKRFVLNPVLAR